MIHSMCGFLAANKIYVPTRMTTIYYVKKKTFKNVKRRI